MFFGALAAGPFVLDFRGAAWDAEDVDAIPFVDTSVAA
jgi:hypothetical protein